MKSSFERAEAWFVDEDILLLKLAECYFSEKRNHLRSLFGAVDLGVM